MTSHRTRAMLATILVCVALVGGWLWSEQPGRRATKHAAPADAPPDAPAPRPTYTAPPSLAVPDDAERGAGETDDIPSGHVAVQTVSLAELREAQDLPPVSLATAEAPTFRRPTERELNDPLFRELYEADGALHRLERLAEIEADEARQFAFDADRETDERKRGILRNSAAFHADLARTYDRRMRDAREARRAVVERIEVRRGDDKNHDTTRTAVEAESGDKQ